MKAFATVAAVLAAVVAASGGQATASIVYDNTVNLLSASAQAGTLEMGDEVTLSGTERTVTAFHVHVLNFTGADRTSDVIARFYSNDGPSGAPGSLLWSYTMSNVTVGDFSTRWIDFSVPDKQVPSTFTWTVQFPSGYIDMDLFSPPTVGSSADFVWVKSGATWQQNTYVGHAANLGASIEATPEPATLSLLALGGLAFLRRRRSR